MVKKTTISSAPCINFKKVKELPSIGEPNTVYYVKGNDEIVVKTYITDINGNPTLISGTEVLPFNFTDLLDAPDSYEGQANKFPSVNSSETGLIFKDISSVAPDLPEGVTIVGDVTIDENYLATIDPIFQVRLNNVLINSDSAPNNTIQLDEPDSNFSRLDIIYVNSDGSYGKVTGIAAPTQITPDTPSNTILIATVFVYGDDVQEPEIDIQPIGGYYKTIGGEISGDVTIKGGRDLRMRARVGSLDSGDIVFQKGNEDEGARISWDASTEDRLNVRFGDGEPQNAIIHQGQIDDGLVFNPTTNKLSVDYNIIPTTFTEITLAEEDEEVIIEWEDYEEIHGTRPVYIDLYEIETGIFSQSTSKSYTEDSGISYKWYVGLSSTRKYEIRVSGKTQAPLPIIPQTNSYVIEGYWVNGYTI